MKEIKQTNKDFQSFAKLRFESFDQDYHQFFDNVRAEYQAEWLTTNTIVRAILLAQPKLWIPLK